MVTASSLWESEALGGDPGFPYLNAVLEVTLPTSDPWRLLAICKDLERLQGRRPDEVRNAPRPLDLDILSIERLVMRSPLLSLPHPRMQGRAFVWRPLAELPDLGRFFLAGQWGEVRGALRRVGGPEWAGLQALSPGSSVGLPRTLSDKTRSKRSVQES